LAETICVPPPVRAPRPPILIGGSGEKKTLRLVAQYADACHLGGGPDVVAHKLDVLRAHCADVGRNYDDIEKTIHYHGDSLLREDADQLAADLEPMARLGISTVTVVPPDPVNAATWIDIFCAAAVPKLAKLS
jgi:alkanesulfonate monooxygenase SsuD/methylene tetrahydromethanopterin reductase-like flavin-dependent oxidoreductase (luciferase family)